MILNSKIILAKNIKMDREYNNVLSYSELQMLELVNQNMVASANDYSFIRERNSILVNFTYNQCLSGNYIAFQNKDYSNKWFFAWIDEVNYKNDKTTEIKFKIDSWSTWFDYWDPKSCYVIREHVSDDTIGKHTIPENLELGDYVLNDSKIDFRSELFQYSICMAVTELPNEAVPPYSNNRNYNGIFGGLYYLGFDNANNCEKAIKIYDKSGKADAINSIFIIPNDISSYSSALSTTWTLTSGSETITTTVKYLKAIGNADTIGNITTNSPSKLGVNYIPKNKKLFTYPYCYFNLTNNSGITTSFRYEDFEISEDNPLITFTVYACISPGMSIKAIPLYYKNENINYNYGIIGGKLPICSWNSDVYLNWLRQNGLNSVFNVIGGVVSTAGGIGSLNIGSTIGGISSVYNALHQYTLADMTPNQAKGNTNAGDVNFSTNNCGLFTIYKMSIKDEYAKIIDDYFTRYGYRINEVKIPNVTGRPNFNYIEIGMSEEIGYANKEISVPTKDMQNINQICRNGVTIWHNHNNLGDYSIDNTI